ncbi:MAG: AzlD domain-containing protein [Proteobacteria bacterium]|nr:AzlD domain-containing protein [Pseudomonadota bacterium]MBU1594995.1 AzlD domain-containing protein [Pseudomonadota bacterium]
MSPLATSLLTICGMALVTYLTRAAGLAVMSRLSVTGRLERFMKAIPAAILASIIAPTALAAGPAEAAATLATAAVAWKTGNLPLAMGAGVAVVLALRLALG